MSCPLVLPAPLICVPEKLTNKTTNTLRWSPRGRHIILATVGSSSKFDLEFWDLDFLTDAAQTTEWGAGVQLLGNGEHYGVTDIDWDPSGRYLSTSASSWRHTVSVFPGVGQTAF